eukprot:854459-Pelagomonas_calceolata.AAC.5
MLDSSPSIIPLMDPCPIHDLTRHPGCSWRGLANVDVALQASPTSMLDRPRPTQAQMQIAWTSLCLRREGSRGRSEWGAPAAGPAACGVRAAAGEGQMEMRE